MTAIERFLKLEKLTRFTRFRCYSSKLPGPSRLTSSRDGYRLTARGKAGYVKPSVFLGKLIELGLASIVKIFPRQARRFPVVQK